jgi:hypothetical protein
MHAKTTTALALAGMTLALPAAASAAVADDPPSPTRRALRAPVAGHLTVAAQMSAAAAQLRAAARARAAAARTRAARAAAKRRQRRRPPTPPYLQAIAACESGGDPATDTGNGFYGKYQFTRSTWQSVGGSGNPAAAPEAEQDRRAAMLYARAGASPWPVCGR